LVERSQTLPAAAAQINKKKQKEKNKITSITPLRVSFIIRGHATKNKKKYDTKKI